MARVMAWNVDERLLAKVSMYSNLTGITRAQIVNDALDLYFKTPRVKKEFQKRLKEFQDEFK